MLTTNVITIEKIADNTIALPTNLRMESYDSAPNLWATGIAKPEHIPIQNPFIKKLIEPVEPTAAKAWSFKICPTIIVSTRLYICWNNKPASIGIEKPRISLSGLPSVILCVVDLAMIPSPINYPFENSASQNFENKSIFILHTYKLIRN